MKKVAQNLHANFIDKQTIDLIEYFRSVTIEWE